MELINIKWDSKAQGIIENFQNAEPYWQHFLGEGVHELGEQSIKYIKDQKFLQASAPFFGVIAGTGALEESLHYEVEPSGNGFHVNFYGLFYGNYIDSGNGNSRIYPKNGQYLAAGSRVGNLHTMKSVAPMGQSKYSGWKPKEFSVKTAEWLAENVHGLLDSFLQESVERMVNL
jgi:hypothetical protein